MNTFPAIILCIALPVLCIAEQKEETIRIVASTLDMGDLAKQIGGDRVEVYSITSGQYDLHFYEPRPSEVMKLKRADMVVVAGMELDAFMSGLIDASRNPNIKFGKIGFVDPSKGINALDVPNERIDGRMGDVHPFGNPHFWFTFDNIMIACSNITSGLIRVSPDDACYFRSRLKEYRKKAEITYSELRKKLDPYRGTHVIQYHPSWNYFCSEFGLDLIAEIEPKPGLAPSASHLSKLVKLINEKQVRLALAEPFYSEKPLKFLSKNSSIRILRLPLNLGSNPEKQTYLDNLTYIVSEIEQALKNEPKQ